MHFISRLQVISHTIRVHVPILLLKTIILWPPSVGSLIRQDGWICLL